MKDMPTQKKTMTHLDLEALKPTIPVRETDAVVRSLQTALDQVQAGSREAAIHPLAHALVQLGQEFPGNAVASSLLRPARRSRPHTAAGQQSLF
jgi:hypothetical protein